MLQNTKKHFHCHQALSLPGIGSNVLLFLSKRQILEFTNQKESTLEKSGTLSKSASSSRQVVSWRPAGTRGIATKMLHQSWLSSWFAAQKQSSWESAYRVDRHRAMRSIESRYGHMDIWACLEFRSPHKCWNYTTQNIRARAFELTLCSLWRVWHLLLLAVI